jgi:hypothetical protein
MKAKGFFLHDPATEFDTLNELRDILGYLNDESKRSCEGADVIKVDHKTGIGYRVATVHFKGDKVIFKKLK